MLRIVLEFKATGVIGQVTCASERRLHRHVLWWQRHHSVAMRSQTGRILPHELDQRAVPVLHEVADRGDKPLGAVDCRL